MGCDDRDFLSSNLKVRNEKVFLNEDFITAANWTLLISSSTLIQLFLIICYRVIGLKVLNEKQRVNAHVNMVIILYEDEAECEANNENILSIVVYVIMGLGFCIFVAICIFKAAR